MLQVSTRPALREALNAARAAGKRIGFVPTMGNLHGGHISLVSAAQESCDFVVCSIFVNPTQFGMNEDIDNYPRTLDADKALLDESGVDLLFTPSVHDMYSDLELTWVEVNGITERHCGASRPNHFRGVATVVCKFLNLVQPDRAYFGRKDYQQLAVIQRMVEDLFIPCEIIGVPTARAPDGLALSSRNGYLTPEERVVAPQLHACLQEAKARIAAGVTDYSALTAWAKSQLEAGPWRLDYFTVCRQADLAPADPEDRNLVILAAAWLGRARLIDNITLSR